MPQLSAASLAAINELSHAADDSAFRVPAAGGTGVGQARQGSAATNGAERGGGDDENEWTRGLRDLSARAVNQYLNDQPASASSSSGSASLAKESALGARRYFGLNELSSRAVEQAKAGIEESLAHAWQEYRDKLEQEGADELATFRAYERWTFLKKELELYR